MTLTEEAREVAKCGSECDYLCQQPDGFGGCAKRGVALSDEQREAAILCAGKAIERHMQAHQRALYDYDLTNNLLDKADADRYRLMAEEAQRHMTALIKGRSAEVVARLEQERGLA